MTAISIENIIVTTHLNHQFNLDYVANQLSEVTYDPNEKAAVIFHFDGGKSAVLLSTNGKIVCTGTTSQEQAEEHIHQVIHSLQKSIEPSIIPTPISLSYILATTDLHIPLSLDTIASSLSDENILYHPDINPWLRYHFNDDLIILLFKSGRVIINARVPFAQIGNAFDTLKNKLSSIGVL